MSLIELIQIEFVLFVMRGRPGIMLVIHLAFTAVIFLTFTAVIFLAFMAVISAEGVYSYSYVIDFVFTDRTFEFVYRTDNHTRIINGVPKY
jgi:hypothetical protein